MGANVATTEAIFASMADTTGAVDEAFAAVSQTTAFQFQQAMAEMKELLLSLGQTLLPLVNEGLQLISDSMRGVVNFFSGLPQPLQDITLGLSGMVAIAGPVALGIGAVTKAMIALKAAAMAHPVLMAFSVAIGAISAAAVIFNRGAREAQERQDALNDAFVAAGDPAATVVTRLEEIAAGMRDVTIASGETEEGVEEFIGSALLNTEMLRRGSLELYDSMGAEGRAAIEGLIESGYDFANQGEELFRNFINLNDASGALTDAYNSGSAEMEAFAQTMLDLIDTGELTTGEFENIMLAIFDTGKAWNANAAAIEENNRLYVETGKVYKDFAGKLSEDVIRDAILSTENYTDALLLLQQIAGDTAAAFEMDWSDGMYMGMVATEQFEHGLVMIGGSLVDAAAQLEMTRPQLDQFIRTAEGFDKLSPEMKFSITFGDVEQQLKALRALIGTMTTEAGISEVAKPYVDLYDALLAMADAADGTGGGGAGGSASSALDEVARAEQEAAREAERLQRDIDRLAERIADLGGEIVGRDFFEFMLGASADEIERKFYDIGQAAMVLVEQAEALGLAGGPEFLQTLANIGVEFDRLAALQSRVASTQNAITTAQSRLADATNDLASAQANLNRENERYAAFLYGEGRGGGTFEQVLQTEIDVYRNLQRELAGVEQEQTGFRQRIIEMMSPTVAGAGGAGGVMGNLGNILAQARTFRNNLIELRDRGFPTDVIGQVVAAGMTNGNVISRRLLALGTAEFEEFLALRDEIGRIGVETAAIAGEVIFGADIAEAQGAVGEQFAVVDAMFQSAIAQAEAQVREQAAVVDRLRAALAALETRLQDLRAGIETLAADIQTAMRAAFDQFLAGLNAAISRLPEVRNLPAPTSSGGGSGGGGGGGVAPAPAPAPAPAAPSTGAYAVQRGDSLWAIAQRTLGSGTRWREIQQANNISGTLIHPGQQLTIPARQYGGPVAGGRPYLVGERGPELFVPSESGTIVSNGQTQAMAGKGAVYNINVHAYGDPAEAGRQIVKAIQEWERRNGSNWRS